MHAGVSLSWHKRDYRDLKMNSSLNNDSDQDIYGDIEEPCGMEQMLNVRQFLQIYVHSVICIVGFIGNTLVIVTYAFYKRTKSMTDVYLLNMAIADILFVVALPMIIFSEQNGWALGNWSCKLLRGIYSINLYSGILLLACISLDRYLAIVQARRSFRFRSQALVYSYVSCAVVWLLALALALPTFIFYQRYGGKEESFIFSNYYDDNVSAAALLEEEYVCYFRFEENDTARQMKVLVPSSQVAVGFCLPLLIMAFCYSSVLVTLLRAKNFQRHKAVRVVLTVVLVFITCHLPYNATLLYDIVHMFHLKDCAEEERTQLVLVLTESLAYLHCCLNPLLYAFVGVKFRNHFRKILQDAWCLGKKYMGARHMSRPTSDAYLSSRRSEGSACETATSFTM